jgi:hypothetical protein
MRFSTVNLLLLSTALAIPLQEQAKNYGSLLAVLPRAGRGRPGGPGRVDAPEPIAPGGPSQDAPVRLGDPDAPVSDPRRPRPNDPNGPKAKILQDARPLDGSTYPDFDRKYRRQQRPANDADFDEASSTWLGEALDPLSEFVWRPKPGEWKRTEIGNNDATKDAYRGPEYESRLREQLEKDGFTKPQIDAQVKILKEKIDKPYYKDVFLDTLENPTQGAMVVKQMYNSEFDIVGPAKKQKVNVDDGNGNMVSKEYTRPGVAEGEDIHLTDMLMDNWRVACGGDPQKIQKLDKLGFDDIVGYDDIFNKIDFRLSRYGDDLSPETKLLVPGDPMFDEILQKTAHGDRSAALFSQNAAELGPNAQNQPKHITKIEVTESPPSQEFNGRRWDAMFYTT